MFSNLRISPEIQQRLFKMYERSFSISQYTGEDKYDVWENAEEKARTTTQSTLEILNQWWREAFTEYMKTGKATPTSEKVK